MDKRTLLDRCGLQGEQRLAMSRVLDKALRASQRGIVTATDFLTPAQQTRAGTLLRGAGLERYLLMGGYEGAERAVLVFLPEWLAVEQGADVSPIRCLRAAFHPGQGLTHRDILGSLMALGVAREKIGDILTGPESADVLVLNTVSDYLLQHWDSAGRTALRLTEVEPGEIRCPAPSFALSTATVSSLRLDAVCAAGFRLSRSEAARYITAGAVQIDGQMCKKPDRQLSPGEKLSVRGKGKVLLEAVGPPTRKGRIPITVRQYR